MNKPLVYALIASMPITVPFVLFFYDAYRNDFERFIGISLWIFAISWIFYWGRKAVLSEQKDK